MTETAVAESLPKFPNGQVDWERVIRNWAMEFGKGFGDAMGWLSKRDNLQQAAELLGYPSAPLGSLGEYLDRHGYSVPPIPSNNRPKPSMQREPQTSRIKEPIDSSIRVTKARYLELRIAGYRRADIAKAYPDLNKLLRTWKLLMAPTEKRAIENFKSTGEPPTNARKPAEPKERRVETVTIELTREQYLGKRLSGMSRRAVANEQGIKLTGLYPYLDKWGLREMDAEERELEVVQQPTSHSSDTPATGGGGPTDDQPMPVDPQQNALPFQCRICGTPVALEGGLCSVKCEDEFTELFTSASGQSDAVQQVEHPVVAQMTREQYLAERKSGKSRAQIAKDEGIELSALDKRLRKWGLKDPIAEQRALDALSEPKTPESDSKTPESEQKSVESVQKMDDCAPKVDEPEPGTGNQVQSAVVITSDVSTSFVTIRVPVDLSTGVPPEWTRANASRQQALQVAVELIQAAIGIIGRDLQELLGTGDVAEHVQGYLDRNVTGEAVAS